jgi:hypothetical protein
MCHYRPLDIIAALTRASAECPADSPTDRRPDVDDITLPPAEKHLVPHTTILEGNLR